MELRVFLWVLASALTTPAGAALDFGTAKIFRGDARGGFGSQVVPLRTQDGGWVLVSAPLSRVGSDGVGRLYRCHPGLGTCQEVPVGGPPGAANASLGLALDAGDQGVLVCAPRVPKFCGDNAHLRGFCVLLDPRFRHLRNLPERLPDCPRKVSDVVFLIDGSGSIKRGDFSTMKKFIWEVMRRFKGTDTQFALTQFSNLIRHHFDFQTFRNTPDPKDLLTPIRQLGGFTLTATAIQRVLREQFLPGKGARDEATKVLIVITDGEKYGDTLGYQDVIPEATAMGVTRYAIGVGNAFTHPDAFQELQTIASQPPRDHLFRVDNFDALQGIQNQLQEKIFSIEGTSSARSSSFQLEMAQEGFSARLSPEGPILGAVGAYDWSGGVFLGGLGDDVTFLNLSLADEGLRDSYLGYSSESLSLGGHRVLALGAPRYRHLGRLLLFHRPGASWELLDQALGTQVGSYFGASLKAVDADGDGEAEVLLVGTPNFYGGDTGGRVAVCSLPRKGRGLECHQMLRGQPGHPLGRFGSSVATLGDTDGDNWGEVAVGAPLEEGGQGAVYIFRGTRDGVAPRYSQRIPPTLFPTPPFFFGQALGGGSDLDGDNLPDLAVGAWGQFLLLRSPPLLEVHPKVTFDPPEVPSVTFACQEEEEEEEEKEVAMVEICFLTTKKTRDNF
ncbi:integrin alpha-D-like, partial [Phaethornis superciliosus]